MDLKTLHMLTEDYIRKLKSDLTLSDEDRHNLALLLLAYIQPHPFLRKKPGRKKETIANDEMELLAFEEHRKTMSHKKALEKTFGKYGNLEYGEYVITRARKYRNQSDSDREQEEKNHLLWHLEFAFAAELETVVIKSPV